MNGKEFAVRLGVPYRSVLGLLSEGGLPAERVKGRWVIHKKDATVYQERNCLNIERMKSEYVNLYRQGLSVAQLQGMARKDAEARGILCRLDGFAERAIYEFVMSTGEPARMK